LPDCPFSLILCIQNVDVWTSFGFLCFYHDDLELASEAFLKAQTLDPDHTMAWVGQALIATRNGHHTDSRMLFEHAVSLSADVVSQQNHSHLRDR
jgi:superkiller protein 3